MINAKCKIMIVGAGLIAASLCYFVEAQGETPLTYRRIFVPAEKVNTWPTEGKKFLPIEAQDFERWVKAANESANKAELRAAITSAEYTAKLEGGQLVGGRGEWTLALAGDGPAFLPLRATSIAMREPRWRGSPELAVRLGVWGQSGGLATMQGLEISRPGVLEFEWSARTQVTHAGIAIPWTVPAANATRLILDLPENQEPHFEGSIVVASDRLPIEASDYSVRRRRWVLHLDSTSDAVLRIEDPRATQKADISGLSLSEHVTYRVTQRGTEVTLRWQLDADGALPAELTVPLPASVEMVVAEMDGQNLLWRVAPGVDDDMRRIVLTLPDAGAPSRQQLTLRAWHPLVGEHLWRLPRLRPEGVAWASSEVELTVTNGLEVRELRPTGYIELGAEGIAGESSSAEAWRFEGYSANAELAISVARKPPDSTVRLGSSLSLGDPDVAGRHVAEWTISSGSVHTLTGRLTDDWIVESVETIPNDGLGEWFVDERDGGRSIEIQLTRSATPSSKVSVVIGGRLPRRSFNETLSAETMRIVQWQDARVAEHDVTFQTTELYAVEAFGELRRIAIDELGDDRRSLLGSDLLENAVFDLAGAGRDAGLRLVARRGQFTADIDVDLTLNGQERMQKFTLAIRPTSNRIDRLLVYCTEKLAEDARWTIASGAPVVASRLAADDPRRSGLPRAGDAWLVELSKPTSRPFEIVLTTAASDAKSTRLPLFALPEAIHQTGRVVVRGDMVAVGSLDARQMQPAVIPLSSKDSVDADGQNPIRTAYRFRPAKCLADQDPPQLHVLPLTGRGTTPIVAERLTIDSFYTQDGAASHAVTYQLRNEGEAAFEVCLPEHAELQSLTVDDKSATFSKKSDGGCFAIRLPAESKVAIAKVTFATVGLPLSLGSKLEPPIIHGRVPVLTGEWTIRLPDGYAISENREFNWRQRLFGPLGREDGTRPFQPLRPADWIALVNSFTGLGGGANAAKVSLAGWHEYEKAFVAEVPVAVYVAHPPLISSWSVSIFLFCLVAGGLIRRQGRAIFIVLIGAAASLALALPSVVAPMATGALIGLLLSLFLGSTRHAYEAESGFSRVGALSTVGFVAFAIAVGIASHSLGQSVDTAPTTKRVVENSTIRRLLIPVDDEGRRVGTKYFVSEEFLRELMRLDRAPASIGGQWLLKDVSYTGEMRQRGELAGLAVGEWSMSCDVEVFLRDAEIVLPLGGGEATWPTSALVDGVPMPIKWLETGDECVITIQEPGEHTIVIAFTPTVTAKNGEQGLTLSIPPHQAAALKLMQPADLEGLTVSGDPVQRALSEGQATEFKLDGDSQLSLRWQASEATASGTRRIQVTELEWLHIGAEEIHVEAKYILKSGGELSDALTIAYDPDWKLAAKQSAPVEELQPPNTGGRAMARVSLAAGDALNNAVTLRWRHVNRRPLGRFKLPSIELVGLPITQRWCAVSSVPSFECVATVAAAQQATAAEFLAVWDEAGIEQAPQIVVKASERSDDWSVDVLPLLIEPEVSQTLHVAVGQAAMRIVYEADMLPGTLHRYQFSLIVPPKLNIDAIAASRAGKRVPVRWARVSEKRVNLFFRDESAGQFQLKVSGTIARDAASSYQLPLVSADSALAAAPKVHLYRDEDVMSRAEGLPPAETSGSAPAAIPTGWRSRRLGVYTMNEQAADKVRLEVRPNNVTLVGDNLTTLAMDGESWVASFHCDVAVEEGMLDTLRLRAPPSWQGPFTMNSSVAATVEGPTRADPRVLIRFSEPVAAGSRLWLDIQGPLALTTAPTTVPEISASPVIRGKRYASVPALASGKALSWNEVGVKETPLPNSLVVHQPARGGERSFEVVGRPFGISLMPPDDAPNAARIAVADSTAFVDEWDRQVIVTRFIVEPQGAIACELELPGGQQLVDVRLDDRPAVVRPTGETTWRVSLGPPKLPCVLDVTARLTDRGSDAIPREIQRPTLSGSGEAMSVDVGLWTFASSAGDAQPTIAVTAGVTAAEQALLRFERLLSIAEARAGAAVELTPPDGDIWMRSWAELLLRARDTAKELTDAPVEGSTALQISQPQDDQLANSSARLDQWLEQVGDEFPSGDRDARSPAAADRDIFAGTATAQQTAEWVHCVTSGELDRLKLDAVPAAVRQQNSQILGVTVVSIMCVASVIMLRRQETRDLIYRWPHAVGFVAGLAYWAWLRPSWLGLLIAGCSVLLAWRSGWPVRAIRMDGSTVLRANRPAR